MAYSSTSSPGGAGMAGRCPRCGQGQLFEGYLKVQPSCATCGLDYSFADSGDGPAFFVMSITSVAAVLVAFIVRFGFDAPMGLALLVAIGFSIVLNLAILQPAKGLLIGLQYKNDAAEGRLK